MKNVFFSLLVLTFLSCTKPCHESDHYFAVSEIFLPEKDSTSVGDTIWVRCLIPKHLTDSFTKQPFYFNNPNNLGSILIVSNISHFSDSLRGAVKDFELINRSGKLYTVADANPTNVIQLAFDESADPYIFYCGLVAKHAGLYLFTFTEATGVYRNNRPKCGISSFTFTNANVNKHLYLFDNYVGSPLSEYDSMHSYCVKVY